METEKIAECATAHNISLDEFSTGSAFTWQQHRKDIEPLSRPVFVRLVRPPKGARAHRRAEGGAAIAQRR